MKEGFEKIIADRILYLKSEKAETLNEYGNVDDEDIRNILSERNSRINFEISFLNNLIHD